MSLLIRQLKETRFNSIKPILSAIFNNQRNYTSALFVPGNRANETFAYLYPDLDFTDRLSDVQKLQNELQHRNVKIDIKELKKTWDHYQSVLANKTCLENKLDAINDQLLPFFKIPNPSSHDLQQKEQLQIQNKVLKQEIKELKNIIWKLEETVVPQVLKLPNEIDQNTPLQNDVLLKSVGEKPVVADDNKQSHMEIGKKLGLLDYKNQMQCYLCDKAAFFELEAMSFAGEILSKNNFTRVAMPDFCRSIVLEGSGMDHESSTESFMMQNYDDVKEEFLVNRLHLVGGASLPALIAMYIKQAFKPSDFPVKIFNTGRHYTPFDNNSKLQGLFSICQTSTVQALILVENKDSSNYKLEFNKLIETMSNLYNEIGCHYRIVKRSVKELDPAECLKISFEMWSVHADSYVEVGHVSLNGDYFSKRLMIGCPSTRSFNYPAAITGNLLSVPKVLGCLMEENPDEFKLPQKFN